METPSRSLSTTSRQEDLFVCVRVSPTPGTSCVEVHSDTEVSTVSAPLGVPGTSGPPRNRRFAFPRVFGPSDSQAALYDSLGPRLLDRALGPNPLPSCLIAYGTTGSGKSHSLGFTPLGLPLPPAPEPHEGILPRLARDLFRRIEASPAAPDAANPTRATVKVSVQFVEVVGDAIKDLLAPPPTPSPTAPPPAVINIREDAKGRITLQGARTVPVASPQDVIAVLHSGLASRGASDGMHTARDREEAAQAHRTHSLFVLHVESTASRGNFAVTRTKITLVDLAGSERASEPRRGSSRNLKGDGRKDEALVAANKGLLALSNVLTALAPPEPSVDVTASLEVLAAIPDLELLAKADSRKGPAAWIQALGGSFRRRNGDSPRTSGAQASRDGGPGVPPSTKYVPFRDSKLTRLLQDALGGPCRTVFLACVNAADAEEAPRTLAYATKALRVRGRTGESSAPGPLENDLKAQLRELDHLLATAGPLGPIPPAPDRWVQRVGEEAAWAALVRMRRELEGRRGGGGEAIDASFTGSLTARAPSTSAGITENLRAALELARAEQRTAQQALEKSQQDAGMLRKGISAALTELRGLVNGGKAPAWVLHRVERAVVRVVQAATERQQPATSEGPVTLHPPEPITPSKYFGRTAATPSSAGKRTPPARRHSGTLGVRSPLPAEDELPTHRLYQLLGIVEEPSTVPEAPLSPEPLSRRGSMPVSAQTAHAPAPVAFKSAKDLRAGDKTRASPTPQREPPVQKTAGSFSTKPKGPISAFKAFTSRRTSASIPATDGLGYAQRAKLAQQDVPSFAAPTAATLHRQALTTAHPALQQTPNIKGWIDIDLDSLSNLEVSSPKANIYVGEGAQRAMPPLESQRTHSSNLAPLISHSPYSLTPQLSGAHASAYLKEKQAEKAALPPHIPSSHRAADTVVLKEFPLNDIEEDRPSLRPAIITNRHSALLAEVLETFQDEGGEGPVSPTLATGSHAASKTGVIHEPIERKDQPSPPPPPPEAMIQQPLVPPPMAPVSIPQATPEVLTARSHLQNGLGAPASTSAPAPAPAQPVALPTKVHRSAFKVTAAVKERGHRDSLGSLGSEDASSRRTSVTNGQPPIHTTSSASHRPARKSNPGEPMEPLEVPDKPEASRLSPRAHMLEPKQHPHDCDKLGAPPTEEDGPAPLLAMASDMEERADPMEPMDEAGTGPMELPEDSNDLPEGGAHVTPSLPPIGAGKPAAPAPAEQPAQVAPKLPPGALESLKSLDNRPPRPPLIKSDTRTTLDPSKVEREDSEPATAISKRTSAGIGSGSYYGPPGRTSSLRVSKTESEAELVGLQPKQKSNFAILPSDVLDVQDEPAFEPLPRIASVSFSPHSPHGQSPGRGHHAYGHREGDVGLDYAADSVRGAGAPSTVTAGKFNADVTVSRAAPVRQTSRIGRFFGRK